MMNSKKRISALLATLMVICVMVSQISIRVYAAEGEKSVVNYVALGDSITYGSNSYVSKVSDYLTGRYGKCVTKNLAIDGLTSTGLVDCLTNSSNAYYYTMRNAIKNADVITLDIGSNDILCKAKEIYAAAFGTTPDQMGAVGDAWVKKVQNASGFQLFMLYLEAMNIALNINYEMNHGNAMPEALASFETNFKKIMTVIKQLAPNAKIYIGNLYNPYVGAAPICCGDYVVVDLENFARTNISKANTIISRNVNGNKVVDLYNTINNPKYIKGDVANCDYDPHPNAEGQKLIASKFIAAMSASN